MLSFELLFALTAIMAVIVAIFVNENPILFGQTSKLVPTQKTKFTVLTNNRLLNTILEHHKNDELDDDFVPYKNHCLRVLSFAQYYFTISKSSSSVTTTQSPQVDDKGNYLTKRQLDILAIALAYHDIGLWIKDGARLNYLEPSVATMLDDLTTERQQSRWGINPPLSVTEIEVIKQIILQHHKFTSWTPSVNESTMLSTDDVLLVNAVRVGDWADVTYGVINNGLPKSHLEMAYNEIPEEGFHNVLNGMGARLSPNSYIGQLEPLQIFKW